MRALSIRQPYAEEILRGIKKIEYRSILTKLIGERFYIYASLRPGDLARFERLGVDLEDLPTGVIVGTAMITKCTGKPGDYQWHLGDVKRLARPKKPKRNAQPVWFNPF